ncbi:MAG TPA: hypothetical protein VHT73_12920 [Thermodesulfobacteriota bacterium]|nr:hypothetical protein [Thermodesulfobacteriota bacterium]
MYSPKISEDLIPRLYKVAKARGVPMTKLINRILKRSLIYMERKEMMKNQLDLPLEEVSDDKGRDEIRPGKDG